jgi:hypothetical protein
MAGVVSFLASTAGLHWSVCGSVGLLTASLCVYRTLTRSFDWGPSDT